MKTLSEYGLHHTGYVVKDREAAISAFEQFCEIRSIKRIDFEAGRAWIHGCETGRPSETPDAAPGRNAAAPYRMKIAMLSLADHPTAIEIIEPLTEGPHMDFVKQTGGGIHHIAFDVNDAYDEWKAKLLDLKAEPLFESETEDETVGCRRCLYVRTPDGSVIEIKETPYLRTR